MPTNIQASVVDIQTDSPQTNDVFFVDTNVWYWVGYPKASQSAQYNQHAIYDRYLNKCINAGGQLLKAALSFSELAHSIERTEGEIFNQGISLKNFRHNYPNERQKVLSGLQATWGLAEALTNQTSLPFTIDSYSVQIASQDINNLELDGYDLFFVQLMRSQNITQVLSDDSDFGSVTNLTVFTANQRLISNARSQGKLVKR